MTTHPRTPRLRAHIANRLGEATQHANGTFIHFAH